MSPRSGLLAMLLVVLAACGAGSLHAAGRTDLPEAFRGAPAVVLDERESWHVVPTRRARHYVRRRILIQSPAGYDQADQRIFYDRSDSDLEEFQARTVLPDGTSIAVPESLKHDYAVAKAGSVELRALQFTFPAVRPGAVLELSYVIQEHDPSVYKAWQVQREIPVLESSFHVNVKQPNYVELTARTYTRANHEEYCTVTEFKEGVRRAVFEMTCRDVPPFRKEEHAPPEADDRLTFDVLWGFAGRGSLAGPWWNALGSIWHAHIQQFLSERERVAVLARELVDSEMSDEDKVNTIYRYIKEELEIHRPYSPELGWVPLPEVENADDVLEQGGGSPSDVAIFALGLLREAGVPAKPILVADRSAGRFVYDMPSSSGSFHLLLQVAIEGHAAILDPACRYCQPGVPDWRHCARETSAITVEPGSARAVTVGVVPASFNSEIRRERVHFSKDGETRVEGTVEWGGQFDIDLRRRWEGLSDEARRDDLLHNLIGDIEDIEVRISDPEAFFEVLQAEYGFTRRDLQRTGEGDLLVRPRDVFTHTLPVPIQESRVHPVWIRYPFTVRSEMTFKIPEGYSIPDLPRTRAVLNGPGLNFRAQWRPGPQHRELVWTGLLTVGRLQIEPDRYPEARSFARDLARLLRGGVLIEMERPAGEEGGG